MNTLRLGALPLLMTVVLTTSASAAEPVAKAPTAEELLDATDDFARGASSKATMSMEVKTKRYTRSMKMTALSQGEDKTLIRILEPVKDAGISTLMVDDNIWNYLPKVDRTMKVPKGMMGGAWMGSHVSNDDLVKANRLADDFTYSITHEPSEAENWYGITLIPKPEAAIVYGKVIVEVSPDKIPRETRYYDEDGSLARTMRFSDVGEFDGRILPKVMTLIPGDKPEEYTKITYDKLDFDIEIDASTFSLQALKP